MDSEPFDSEELTRVFSIKGKRNDLGSCHQLSKIKTVKYGKEDLKFSPSNKEQEYLFVTPCHFV